MSRIALAVIAGGLALNMQSPLASALGFSVANCLLVGVLLPAVAPALVRVGFNGVDRNKVTSPILPETLGVVVGLVYIVGLILFIPWVIVSDDGNTALGQEHLSAYLSALLSFQSMTFLGVMDDLFDLRWRHKFLLPAIAAIPMLVVYHTTYGETNVVLPPFLKLGRLELGPWYYVYMSAVSIFCTNCINIYAGVNGLEVGQSIVIGLAVLANDALYLMTLPSTHPAFATHSFSLYLVLPFVGASIALLRYNWWPAKGFVGDTYCYLAGMVFAVVGILGHFTKTMLALFVPQIFNFCYSVPQLFHVVPCPRHRMPVLNRETGLLEPSYADVTKVHPFVKHVLRALAALRLVEIREDGKQMLVSNLTLINLTLVRLGPMREDRLAAVLLALQIAWCIAALVARHMLARLVFGRDNR